MPSKTVKPKAEAQVSVAAFGQGCLDAEGSTVSGNECEAMAQAWLRAADAIRNREYGEITVEDDDGDELLAIGIDYENVPFDMEKGLPPLAKFKVKK